VTLTGPALVERALTLAVSAFRGDVDRGGKLKVLHSLRVGLASGTPEGQAAGFLHDVLEDTPLDAAFLRESGIPGAVVDAVETVTRRRGEVYRDFIERVARGPMLAITTKIADLDDNLLRSGAWKSAGGSWTYASKHLQSTVGLSQRYMQARDRLAAEVAVRVAGEASPRADGGGAA